MGLRSEVVVVVKVVAAVMDGHKYELTTALQSRVEINSKKPPAPTLQAVRLHKARQQAMPGLDRIKR